MLIESIDDENLNIKTDLTVLDNLLCQRCKKNLKEYLKIKVKEAEIKNMELITGARQGESVLTAASLRHTGDKDAMNV